jgi:putative oxidoreductase
MFRRLISTSSVWVTVPLRLAMGVIFVAHGSQKVLSSFEGPGLAKFTSFPAPFPFMRPAWLWLGAAAFSELIGGILIFLGLLTRVGAFLIACVMLTALIGVHWPYFFVPKGIEYPLALLATSLALLFAGGGMASVDLALTTGRRR